VTTCSAAARNIKAQRLEFVRLSTKIAEPFVRFHYIDIEDKSFSSFNNYDQWFGFGSNEHFFPGVIYYP